MSTETLRPVLERIAAALERLAPPAPMAHDFTNADAFVWHADREWLEPIEKPNRLDLRLLIGVDGQRDRLVENTRRFARGLPANNALLWGARGTGKSSLVKAVHGEVAPASSPPLCLVEIHREEIPSLSRLLHVLRPAKARFIVFCDDLSFEDADHSYKALKALLEGGIEGRPENVVFYATSNRRHLMSRAMIENERASAIMPAETVEEKVSLSDRFGLWLGFHNMDQDTYLAIVDGYVRAYGLAADAETLRSEAIAWAATRGARSGRVAWQFIQDLAGRLEQRLESD